MHTITIKPTFGNYTALKMIINKKRIVRIFNNEKAICTYTKNSDDKVTLLYHYNDCYKCLNKPFNRLCTLFECVYIPNLGIKGLKK